MIFRDFYKVMRCNILHVKVGKTEYEYGIFAKETENRPHITELFSCEIIEISPIGEDEIFIKLKGRKNVSI